MSGRREIATLGGGCFWCLEAVFEQLQGVEKVVNGYAGGFVDRPTYEQVCSETTGHAEVVQVTFDPAVLSYRDLLEVFFTIHDPTTKDRQGNDVGSQYRSVIFHRGPEQEAAAREVMAEVAAKGVWDAPLVTELAPSTEFFPAEPYHQGYFRRNPAQGYCRAIISPKVAKFRKSWQHRLKPVAHG
jgi:peptide-methionine (S)-S-oxide reductase